MRKTSLIYIFTVLFFSCQDKTIRTDHVPSVIDTGISEQKEPCDLILGQESEPFSFVSKIYRLENTNILYATYTNQKDLDIFEDYEELFKLLDEETVIELEENTRTILSDTLMNHLFYDDGLDTITVYSYDNKFETKAKRIGVEYLDNSIEGQFVTTFTPIKSLEPGNNSLYGFRLKDSQITLKDSEFYLFSDNSFIATENIEKEDSSILLISSFWQDQSQNLKYGFKAFSDDEYSNFYSKIYKLENDSIIFQSDIFVDNLIVREMFPSKLYLNEFPILISELALVDTDFIIDATLYYSEGKYNISYGTINK